MNAPQPLLEPLVASADKGASYELGNHRWYVLVSARSSGGTLLRAYSQVDPGASVPLHVHTREDETFYLLEGRFDVTVGGQTFDLGPGDCVFAPRNRTHAWRCTSADGGQMLVLVTPGENFEAFVLEMEGRGINPPVAMADPALRGEFIALAARHGITILP